jgi:protoheme IX farnesyltransferase
MSTPAAANCQATAAIRTQAIRSALVARVTDYVALAKPRIALLALLAVSAGFALASRGDQPAGLLLSALVGIGLVAAGSSAFNQLLERSSDARMARTAGRPLPAGRLSPREAFLFATLTSVAGVAWLSVAVNATCALLSALTLVLYAGAYTPLKRKTSLATALGAVPGAMPPVLGWVAAGGPLDGAAFSLFSILFLWQFPHFLAIGWIYREQYARAGLKMVPLGGNVPRATGLLAVGYALVLVPVSVTPAISGLTSQGWGVVGLALAVAYVLAALRFAWRECPGTARGLLWASLLYLPVLLVTLVWDHLSGLS